MRVLHLTLSFHRGGRRCAITTLIEHLRPLGVSSDLCCLDELGCEEKELDRVIGAVKVLKRRSVFDQRAVNDLIRFCQERSIQVIHAHDGASQFTGAMVRLSRPGIKLLLTYHRSLSCDCSGVRDRIRNAMASALCGAVVAGSWERRQFFLSENYISPAKVLRIPLGVDTDRFRPDAEQRLELRRQMGWDHRTTVIGTVGHFGPEKGVDQVIRAFELLSQRSLPGPLVLAILGTGTAEQVLHLRSLAERISGARVWFAGHRPDPEHWFATFDILAHAPRLEAFGLVLAEAMATGLPIVATSVGGVPDLVRDGENGYLTPMDRPELLADHLERLIRDPLLRARMGEASLRAALTEFSAARYAQDYLKLYEDLMEGRQPAAAETEAALSCPKA